MGVAIKYGAFATFFIIDDKLHGYSCLTGPFCTRRLRAIRDVDPVDDVLVAEAGVTMAEVQAAAAAVISAGTDDVVAVRDTAASLTYVFADTDGDNAIDTVVELTGLVTLAQTDFIG